MKILVISNLYPPRVHGGFELACAQAVAGLRTRGHEVTVLTSTPGTIETSAEPGVMRVLRLAEIFDPVAMSRHSPVVRQLLEARSHFVDAGNVAIFVDVVAATKPDVVYLWNTVGLGGLGLTLAIQHLGLPWVWHLEDMVPRTLCSVAGEVTAEARDLFNHEFCGSWIGVSSRVLSEIQCTGLRLRDRVALVPNWVDTPPLPRRWWRPGEPLRVAFAGGVIPEKGVAVLLEAVRLLLDDGWLELSVDLFGDLLDDGMVSLWSSLGLRDVVRLRGQIPPLQLARELAEHDLFVFPSWAREPFGMAPLEAANQGCVPLLPFDAGISEWLVDGVHCVKCRRDPESVAKQVLEVLNGNLDLEALGRRGRHAVATDFALASLMSRVEAILDEASTRRRPPKRANPVVLGRVVEQLLYSFVEERWA